MDKMKAQEEPPCDPEPFADQSKIESKVADVGCGKIMEYSGVISDWCNLMAENRRPSSCVLTPKIEPPGADDVLSRSLDESNKSRLQNLLERFNVTVADVGELAALQGFEIVVVCDDSGSMRNCAIPPQLRRIGDPAPSRWDELRSTVELVVDLGSCFCPSGIDVHFLNRDSVLGVTKSDDPKLARSFRRQPTGDTPLVGTLQRVCAEFEEQRDVLLIVATDGLPTEGCASFSHFLGRVFAREATKAKLRMQIMACTDDEEALAWLNEVDAKWEQVDVTDDYQSELQEVLRAGRLRSFRRSDWVVKALLGPVLPEFDAMDEKKRKKKKGKKRAKGSVISNYGSCCCVIS
eukprot:Hpha_TRINITY_DN15461_c2_g1::TRINITY_DN15461_c2_g1_i1::g.173695::m.173695